MKKTGILALLIVVLFTSVQASAQYKMGLGIRFSTDEAVVNNSISFKYFLNESTAAEALLSFGDPLAIGVLLEKHKPLISNKFRWFYGGGGYVGFGDRKNVGLQGVVGLDYKLPLIPLNLSIDWKPELNLTRSFFFEPEALAVSARFTFR